MARREWRYLRCTKRVGPCKQPYVREEVISEHIDQTISKVTLEAVIADAMVEQLTSERQSAEQAEAAAITEAKTGIAAADRQLDRLLDLRLSDEPLPEAEYLRKKEEILKRKVALRAKLDAFQTNRHNRFEPAIQFVLNAKHGAKLISEGTPEEKRDFLKKIGSNLLVADKTLAVTFKTPWQFVAEWNSSVARERADNQFSLTGVTWRRGGETPLVNLSR